MSRTTVDLDREALAAAQRALGKSGLSETVNAALRRVAGESVLAEFDVLTAIDGTPDEVARNREDRAPADS